MTDLINWDEPIETVDGEPCEVVRGPDAAGDYLVRTKDTNGYWYRRSGEPWTRDAGRPRIRNVSKPKPASKTDVRMGDRALVWFPVKGVRDETIYLDTIVGSLPIDRNSPDIHSIEPRPLKVGDPVRFRGETTEWRIKGIDDGCAWLLSKDGRITTTLDLLERIA
jgi:hypothetical protein